jgi:hypothetical protein
MTPPHPFRLFGPSHLAVLGVTAAVTAGLVGLARRARGTRRPAGGGSGRAEDGAPVPGLSRDIAWSLAALLLLDEAAVAALAAHADLSTLKDHLPSSSATGPSWPAPPRWSGGTGWPTSSPTSGA